MTAGREVEAQPKERATGEGILSSPNLETYLKSFAADRDLRSFQEPIQEDLVQMQIMLREFFQTRVPLIQQVGEHLLTMSGKKFRPALTLLVCRMGNASARDAAFAAAAIELIHTATLVHDDTIDKSAIRRGLPTINALYNDLVATILGDYIYTKVLVDLLDRNAHSVVRAVTRTTYEMSIGEMLQIQQKRNPDLVESEYLELVDAKTASLMSAACEVGGLVGGLSAERVEALRLFGLDLGRAYQITDDIFDYFGDAAKLGKVGQSDLAEGKVTLPLIRALSRSTGEEKARVAGILQQPVLTTADWQFVFDLLKEKQAFEECREVALASARQAHRRLEGFPTSTFLTGVHQAVEYAVNRSH
jgi:octaprenyl-diphosphate synthase